MTEQVALVTGASRGIGKAIAQQLGQQGFIVIGTATTEAGAENISNYLNDASIKGQGMMLNVTDPESMVDVLKTIADSYGAPAVLVKNSGITKYNQMMRMKDEDWSYVIDTNQKANFRLSKACIRGMMKARWGRIINISSVVGSMGNMGQVNYAATKAGVEGFSRSLAKELGSRNITVNSIAPGFIDTDMTKGLPEDHKAQMLAQIPLGRLGEPREIAGVVGLLVGDVGGYITGETIHVNGGMYMA
jgi:3-oxoacyl-[acyl-carrier protein] reductase